MIKTEAQRYLGIGPATFNNFKVKYNVRTEKIKNKILYNVEDLDRIKAELDERKRIALPPVYKQFKRPDWKPEPRETYYDLQDICKMLECSKVHGVNIINACEYKFAKFYTKVKKIYYLRREIDDHLFKEIRKLNFTGKSKIYKVINR